MSTGFRLFLLILLGFGAVWIYRFRAPELNLLLSPIRPVLGEPGGASSGPRDRARGRLEPPVRPGWEQVRSADWNLASWDPERLEAGETPWRETGDHLEEPPYERLEHDPDLVSGAFEEASDEVAHVTYEEDPPQPPPVPAVEREGGEESGSDAEPASGTVEVDYVVQEGDNLWTLAKRFLGKGHRHREISELNSLTSPTLVPGTRLRLRVPENRAPEENLKSTPGADDKSVEESSDLEESSLTLETYKVKARETLSEIASRYFPGDPQRLDAFLEANRDTVSSPDEIREGQILVIPPRR